MGLTAAIRAERAIGCSPCSPLSVYGGLRGSLLYGNSRHREIRITSSGWESLSDNVYHDDMISIWQISVGAQYKRCLNSGGYAFVRGGFEVQTWEQVGNYYAPVGLAGNDGDIGLAGFTGALGIVR